MVPVAPIATPPADETAKEAAVVELALIDISPAAVWLIALKDVNANEPLVPVAPISTPPAEETAKAEEAVELALIDISPEAVCVIAPVDVWVIAPVAV